MCRVTGGSDWNILDSPYVVSINYYGEYECVGSLITFWHVVTAGHCLINLDENHITVAAGVSDVRDIQQNGQSRNALRIRYAPNFNSTTLDLDIAVIKVSEPFEECDTIKTIQLCCSKLTPRTAMRVSGWGLTAPGNEDVPFILQSAVLYILKKDECVDRYATTGVFFN
ncbi:trypsin isoform X3 [Eurosta solidaginis]|uniref:trypsin isoform X3 n=1 Tax=Eurosta solidaginis TaxID=178769 RepID=UPI003530CA39